MNTEINKIKIFNLSKQAFEQTALELFRYQYHQITIYREFTDSLKVDINIIDSIHNIPFLPIQFFKSHKVFNEKIHEEKFFESSGTTSETCSKHFIHDLTLYEVSILHSFNANYGNPAEYVILALLPHYLERDNSSLVYMVNYLMKESKQSEAGFYLNNFNDLESQIKLSIKAGKRVILFGVTFALLDFFEAIDVSLDNVIIIETGGMKGKRKEITKEEFYQKLSEKIPIENIHSEYGMTELLSPSFSKSNQLFIPPTTAKMLVRDVSDPFFINNFGRGALNIIDLANMHSCSFIATDDLVEINQKGHFEILGRLSNSDIRGCNLMYH